MKLLPTVPTESDFRRLLFLVAVLVLLTPGLLFAQDQADIAPEKLREKALSEAERPDGWNFKLKLGGTISFSHSSKVVGTDDGSSVQIGLVLDGAANAKYGQHELENTLAVQHTQTLTPTVDRFVKTADNLELKSLYFYRLSAVPWIGPYGRARLQTAVLEGYAVRTKKAAVRRTSRKEEVLDLTFVDAEDNIDLTDPFEPLLVVESGGFFANPIEGERFTLKTKLGIALQHLIIQNGYRVAGESEVETADLVNPDEPAAEILVELRQLQGSSQLGGELDLELSGVLVPEVVTWSAKVNFLMPFHSTSDNDPSGIDALNTDLSAGLSVKLAKWASLDYVLKVKRIPLVTTDWQITNGLLLTAGFDIL